MAAGYLLPISSDGYLLLGIPLTSRSRSFVRRRPVRELFAAGTSRFRWIGGAERWPPRWLRAAGLRRPKHRVDQTGAVAGWYLAAPAGAVCAAFALRAGGVRGALRSAALPIAVGASGMALVYTAVHVATGAPLSVRAHRCRRR